MSKFHSQRKVVRDTRTSACTCIITVEDSSDGVAVKVDEHLTDWAKSFPNTSQKVSSRPRNSLEDAEAHASQLLDARLRDGFFLAL